MRFWFTSLFIIIFSICTYSQVKNSVSDSVILTERDTVYSLRNHTRHFIDKSQKLTLKDIKNKVFTTGDFKVNANYNYWFKFKLEPKKNSELLILYFGLIDFLDIYIPQKKENEYYILNKGILNKIGSIEDDVTEASIAKIDYDLVNFSKPFFIKMEIISDWGEQYVRYPLGASLTDDSYYSQRLIAQQTLSHKYKFYVTIILATFGFFFINYTISKDKNYLNYSLYLLATALIFAPRIPFFFNFLNANFPTLFHYLRPISIMSASGFYFYFVISFLNLKTSAQKTYKIASLLLKCICGYAIVYVITISIYPHLPYKIVFIKIFKYFFTAASLLVFTFLLFQKGDKIYKAVLVSSLFLIIGNILSAITQWSLFFLNTVLVEIVIFTAIVSYANKINSKKRLENKYLLEKELENKKNLIELDNAKTNFFTNISHEFRTPLTLITIPIDAALEDQTISKEKKQQFIIAKRNSERLLDLVNQLLDLSKIDAGQLNLNIQKGKIVQLISTLSEPFLYQAKEKGITFNLLVKNKNQVAFFDKDAVEKIVTNLMSNAVKYTPNGGEIVSQSTIEHNILIFEIKNTGKGLTTEEQQQIFERFYQTTEQNTGSGIGLALVKELVELHRGELIVNSKPNTWTNFKVKLPVDKNSYIDENFVEDQKSKIISTQSTEFQSQALNTTTDIFKDTEKPILLIVEDHADLRLALQQNFNKNYNTITAKNGNEGITLALEHVPDIIISDIMMPVKDGIELTKTLKSDERTSHIPIILLTAKAGDENKLSGIEVGADDYITKPFNSKILTTKVAKLIETRKLLQKHYSKELVLIPEDITTTHLDEQFLKKVKDILDKSIVESSFSVNDFSEAAGMSRMQLHRKLKALTGLSTTEFLRIQRLKLAANLLKTSNTNISQVGYSVGFNDHSYFTKSFKDYYNCTPTEFAKS